MRYVIGIGSNIGDKKENIERAIAAIETLPKTRIVLKSSIYETQPVGYEDQDVAKVELTLKKPEAPMKADFSYVGVKIERER